jgi:hypothetical protein
MVSCGPAALSGADADDWDGGLRLDAGGPDAGVDAGLDAGTPDAGLLPPARLSVSGRWILSPDGGSIILRGYNWGQWGTAQPLDATDNRAQGANSVRLPLRWWGDWKPGVDSRSADAGAPGHLDPAHLAVLDQTIAWATAQGLWVVLFVDSNYGQGANGATDNFWTDPVLKQQFIEVWQFLVRRYLDTPFIAAWEILPEPQVNVPDADIRGFYESIIPFIRAIDPRTPIVIGAGNAYSLKLLNPAHTVDSQIIYTGDDFVYYGELDGGERIPYVTDFIATYDAPVWINQLGVHGDDPDGLAKAQNVLRALSAAQVGWAWWTYRELATTPKEYGLSYSDASDGGWVLKPDWFSLVGHAFEP